MKLKLSLLTLCLLLFAGNIAGQKASELVYVDASELTLINKGFDNTELDYSRLPLDLKDRTREAVWSLGLNSAGLAVRFSSNAHALGARWTLLNNFHMNHMAATGIRGIDLYTLEGNTWKFIGTAQPNGKESSNVFVRNMDGSDREYLAYLPLYDGVTKVEFGADSGAVIAPPKKKHLLSAEKPYLFYGTSITQGGCVSRPGMAYPSIIGRRTQKQIVNLGFSGNARMDQSMAEAIVRVDAECYVIDCLPNCTAQIIRDSAYNFITYLCKERPETPLYMVENVTYPYTTVDVKSMNDLIEKNNLWKDLYYQLLDEGYNNLKYISTDGQIGFDNEGTVDGSHMTDLGTYRMSNYLMEKMGLEEYIPSEAQKDEINYSLRNVVIVLLIFFCGYYAFKIRWRGAKTQESIPNKEENQE